MTGYETADGDATWLEAGVVAIGLVILLAAAVITLDIILENTDNLDATVFGQTLSNVDLGGFFTAGVLTGIAGTLGLGLLLAGLKRGNRRRRERKELSRSYAGTAHQAETLQQERDRLAHELEQERMARQRAEAARRAPTGPEQLAGHDVYPDAPQHERHGLRERLQRKT